MCCQSRDFCCPRWTAMICGLIAVSAPWFYEDLTFSAGTLCTSESSVTVSRGLEENSFCSQSSCTGFDLCRNSSTSIESLCNTPTGCEAVRSVEHTAFSFAVVACISSFCSLIFLSDCMASSKAWLASSKCALYTLFSVLGVSAFIAAGVYGGRLPEAYADDYEESGRSCDGVTLGLCDGILGSSSGGFVTYTWAPHAGFWCCWLIVIFAISMCCGTTRFQNSYAMRHGGMSQQHLVVVPNQQQPQVVYAPGHPQQQMQHQPMQPQPVVMSSSGGYKQSERDIEMQKYTERVRQEKAAAAQQQAQQEQQQQMMAASQPMQQPVQYQQQPAQMASQPMQQPSQSEGNTI